MGQQSLTTWAWEKFSAPSRVRVGFFFWGMRAGKLCRRGGGDYSGEGRMLDTAVVKEGVVRASIYYRINVVTRESPVPQWVLFVSQVPRWPSPHPLPTPPPLPIPPPGPRVPPFFTRPPGKDWEMMDHFFFKREARPEEKGLCLHWQKWSAQRRVLWSWRAWREINTKQKLTWAKRLFFKKLG